MEEINYATKVLRHHTYYRLVVSTGCMHVDIQIVSFAKRHSKTSHSKRFTKHHQASVPSQTAFAILNSLSHVSCHFFCNSHVPENGHMLKNTRPTFSPFKIHQTHAAQSFCKRQICRTTNFPASYVTRLITVFARAHHCTPSWTNSNHTHVRIGINMCRAKNTKYWL